MTSARSRIAPTDHAADLARALVMQAITKPTEDGRPFNRSAAETAANTIADELGPVHLAAVASRLAVVVAAAAPVIAAMEGALTADANPGDTAALVNLLFDLADQAP